MTHSSSGDTTRNTFPGFTHPAARWSRRSPRTPTGIRPSLSTSRRTTTWVDAAWHTGLPVVVRRDVDNDGRIPVGVNSSTASASGDCTPKRLPNTTPKKPADSAIIRIAVIATEPCRPNTSTIAKLLIQPAIAWGIVLIFGLHGSVATEPCRPKIKTIPQAMAGWISSLAMVEVFGLHGSVAITAILMIALSAGFFGVVFGNRFGVQSPDAEAVLLLTPTGIRPSLSTSRRTTTGRPVCQAASTQVVVRRDVDNDGRIPVGVRGLRRDQRAAGWVKPGNVLRVVSPEELCVTADLLRSPFVSYAPRPRPRLLRKL